MNHQNGFSCSNHSALDISPDNIGLIESLYESYLSHSPSLDPSWKNYFDIYNQVSSGQISSASSFQLENLSGIDGLIHAYRKFGHLSAQTNPLHPLVENGLAQPSPSALNPSQFGIDSSHLQKLVPSNGILEGSQVKLEKLIERLHEIYCGSIGYEYLHCTSQPLQEWLKQAIENHKRPKLSLDDKRQILLLLNHSELFEVFLHTRYSGQKRFSLEGGETLIPLLHFIIESSSALGAEEFYLGMAHRGRLNVLSNILKKSHEEIFNEFEESYVPLSFEGSGDVKYHLGFTSKYRNRKGNEVLIALSPNPSHLESVNGVVQGIARARQHLASETEFCTEQVAPILIHGDAALAGQGICYETLQFSRLAGYSTGGTIHIVINNQIGFTTLPRDGRSTLYCTDIAKAFGMPVFHVNGDDPEACVFAAQLAAEIRQRFKCDVFIDLLCYRKYGHNETDEPSFTQPIEYEIIRNKKGVRELYRDDLIHQGVVERKVAEALEEEFRNYLALAMQGKVIPQREIAPPAVELQQESTPQDFFQKVNTYVTQGTLEEITEKTCILPNDLIAHPKVASLYANRHSMVIPNDKGERLPIDWGMGEMLAFGTLLNEGVHVRLSGQDSRRGTFSHRHAIVKDQKTEKKYFPLNTLGKPGLFQVFNSPLSEYGCMGFEYGYSKGAPGSLVIWEAQFGDFANGAQIIIDQYIATSEQKWNETVGLTLFLPHGYEGQGPEHSSGRIERFLTVAGQQNIRIVVPSTPAQLFHLLRRQVHIKSKKPLIVFTPKGLLRHKLCVSTLDELTSGGFEEIIDDPNPNRDVKRLLICSGRIYYDLLERRNQLDKPNFSIVRIEQLYPLNQNLLVEIIQRYPKLTELIWVQDEPANMGAWEFVRSYLFEALPKGCKLFYVGRERSASPATGSHLLHKKQHSAILNSACTQAALNETDGV